MIQPEIKRLEVEMRALRHALNERDAEFSNLLALHQATCKDLAESRGLWQELHDKAGPKDEWVRDYARIALGAARKKEAT